MARPKNGVSFWDRVSSQMRLGENGCHEFTGNRDENGYGRIRRGDRLVRLHRAKWELCYGEIPPGMCVCHKCDNPPCINQNHLSLGSHQDNMKDRSAKGRCASATGSQNNSAKLTESDVVVIKQRIASGEACYAIARDYSVSGEAILRIKNGHSWRHVA